jgi:hypothetical protein
MTEYPSVVRPGRVSGPPRHRRGRRPGRRAAAVRDGERGPHPPGTADLGRQAWEMMLPKLESLLSG